MLDHVDKLADSSAKAISNIKFDKVVVWDGGKTGEGDGNATSNFIRGIATALPPSLQIMKDVAGVEMPEYFGKVVSDTQTLAAEAKSRKERVETIDSPR